MNGLREQWLLLFSTPFYAIVILLELVLGHLHDAPKYSWKDSKVNLAFMIMNTLVDLACRLGYLWILGEVFLHRLPVHWNPVAYWICLLLAEDFLYYWLHRFDHEIRLFWAVHVTHHNSEKLNFSTGFRSSVFEPLYRFVYFLPLAWLGFRPLDIVFIYSLTQIWGTLVHTELVGRLGWLEYVFVTPSHHRVHHASNVRYLDRNLGMFLIIWDRLFGTFQEELPAEEYEPIRYGLTKPPEDESVRGLLLNEWQEMGRDVRREGLTPHERWMYLVGPPGWSHDGSRKTTRMLRGHAVTLRIQKKGSQHELV